METHKTEGPIYASPTVDGDAVYFPSTRGGYPVGWGPTVTNGTFYKLDANSGSIIWRREIPYVLNRTSGSGNFLLATATVAEGKVFVRNGFYFNYALNATNGETIWTSTARFNEGTPTQWGGVIQINAPLYRHGYIYMNDYYGIVCLNATTGKEQWFTFLSRENLSPALAFSYGRVYTVNEVGNVFVLDWLTGEKLAYYEIGAYQIHSSPSLYNGSLYVGCHDYSVYCLTDFPKPEVVTTEMSLTLSANRVEKGDKIYIEGGVHPVNYRVPITLTLDRPDTLYVDIPVMTDENGNFQVIQTFDVVGDWKIVAWWNGDDLHTAASSQTLSLSVIEPAVAPPPEYPQPMDYTIHFVGVAAVLLIAIVLVGVWIKKK
ncbi:MAG: PQQ-binding-like beta-propeller repeat protein [Candidatus Bathyarchaeota archaeon]|nr:PQQ-binding-like beta-propeller repeat protein [Candidatus Bathyarchaeota archaeon]